MKFKKKKRKKIWRQEEKKERKKSEEKILGKGTKENNEINYLRLNKKRRKK